jgi:integrase
MEAEKPGKTWERTNVTNLVRNGQSGTYYARVKVNGKEKWRTLKTKVFTVAKLRLGDVEKQTRANVPQESVGTETLIGHFITRYKERTRLDSSLAASSRERRESAIKALVKTWPGLEERDVRRITPTDCQEWAASALRVGTGFVAPRAKTKRVGMSASSFNKTIDVLRAILELAKGSGVIYANPADELEKAPLKKKRLELPSIEGFEKIVHAIRTAGSRWSKDAADLVRFLVYSGARLREATAVCWSHIDESRGLMTIPGSKTESSYRVIPLFPKLGEHVKALRVNRDLEPSSTPVLKVGECLTALRHACQDLGMKPLTHHDLRHLFATRCIESGVDIPTVSRWLGHSDGGALAMQTYGHLRQEHSLAAAAKVRF